MENPRRKTAPSCDRFSFPVIVSPPELDTDQFEFGSVTAPGSPNSPADRLFSNGKLLPHVFPVVVQAPLAHLNFSYSRSTSRASSIGSKDSLVTSRSNSTSSTCSSARTSTSEAASDRKLSPTASVARNGRGRTAPVRRDQRSHSRPPCSPYYSHGSSQRWQLIAAAPALTPQVSRSSSRKVGKLERIGSAKSPGGDVKLSLGRRIWKSLVSGCKECHSIRSTTTAVEL